MAYKDVTWTLHGRYTDVTGRYMTLQDVTGRYRTLHDVTGRYKTLLDVIHTLYCSSNELDMLQKSGTGLFPEKNRLRHDHSGNKA